MRDESMPDTATSDHNDLFPHLSERFAAPVAVDVEDAPVEEVPVHVGWDDPAGAVGWLSSDENPQKSLNEIRLNPDHPDHRMLAMSDFLDEYSTPRKKRKKERKKRVKSRAKSFSWEESPYQGTHYKGLGLTNIGAFIRLALEFYMAYNEVAWPQRGEDGEILLDSWGRPRPTKPSKIPDEYEGLEIPHRIKTGAVWMSKHAMLNAWTWLFDGGYYRDVDPNHYVETFHPDTPFAEVYRRLSQDAVRTEGLFIDNKTRTTPKRKSDSSHTTIDVTLQRMLRNGRLIRCSHTNGRFMFSKEACELAKMPEAWDEHMRRGQRWEGLYYETQVVPVSAVYPQKTYHFEEPTLERQVPHTTTLSVRHPNQLLWVRVLEMLSTFVLFDRYTVMYFAKQLGIFPDDHDNYTTIATHLMNWQKNQEVKRIFPGLYRAEGFWEWNAKREKDVPVRIADKADWMIHFFIKQSYEQFIRPKLHFMGKDVEAWLKDMETGLPHEQAYIDKWFAGRDIRRGSINERLTQFLEKDYVERVGHGKWRLTDYTMEACRPAWALPGDYTPDTTVRRFIRANAMKNMPLDEAIKALLGTDETEVIKTVIERVFHESEPDEIVVGRRFQKIAKRIGYPSIQKMLFAYKNGAFDEGS